MNDTDENQKKPEGAFGALDDLGQPGAGAFGDLSVSNAADYSIFADVERTKVTLGAVLREELESSRLEQATRVLRLIAEWSGDEFTGAPARSQWDMYRLARDFLAKTEGK